MHSFLRLVMMLSTPSEGSEALPDMRAATDLDLNTSLYSSTCSSPMHAVCFSICASHAFCISKFMYPGELLAEAPVMTPYSVDFFPLLFYVVHIDLDLNMSFDCSISNVHGYEASVSICQCSLCVCAWNAFTWAVRVCICVAASCKASVCSLCEHACILHVSCVCVTSKRILIHVRYAGHSTLVRLC